MNTIDTSVLDSLGLSQQPAEKSENLGQSEFLNLMITQLKNQDPFKPMESGEFLGQIAQFGTVSGIQDLQKSFDTFASSQSNNQTMQAAGLVGRYVLAPTGSGYLFGDEGLGGAVDMPTSSEQVTVKIYDANGGLVKQLPLGPQAAGLANFYWDGLDENGVAAAPGKYLVKAEALVNGSGQAVEALVASPVASVTLNGKGGDLTLNIAGYGSLELSSVRQIM